MRLPELAPLYESALRRRLELLGETGDERACARALLLELRLHRLAQALASVQADGPGPYAAAFERAFCELCDERDVRGNCAFRERGACSYDAGLALVLDAVEEIRGPFRGC